MGILRHPCQLFWLLILGFSSRHRLPYSDKRKKQENYSQITLIEKHVLQYLSDFSRLIGREFNSP